MLAQQELNWVTIIFQKMEMRKEVTLDHAASGLQ